VLTLDERPIDDDFFRVRLRAAAARRAGYIVNTNAWRVVNGESDELPGLIVDRFADVLVMQIRNAGMERLRATLIGLLAADLNPRGIYERSDVEARTEEGLEPNVGAVWGEVPAVVEVVEDDLCFAVNLSHGQKTGFYLDQRDNRRRLQAMVRAGDRVLDVYSYVGAFGLHAARAGASVLCVDKDTSALALAEEAARRNGVAARVGVRWGDAVEALQELNDEGRRFSHVVLDPPTLVKRREELARTRRLFVEMCTMAMRLLDPDGILFLSSCAFYVSAQDLLEVARQAAGIVRRRVVVLDVTYQPADHPWILQIAETLYLKTLILRVE
jgi:23S rRNA (cytosine1962-C5)-methyltransferase